MAYIIKKMEDTKPIEITCGTMHALFEKESPDVSVIHVTIHDVTKKHYHKKLTEIYYIIKGAINMELDGKVEHLEKGSLISIAPNTHHKAWKTSEENAEVLVICSPPWTEEDEVWVEQ